MWHSMIYKSRGKGHGVSRRVRLIDSGWSQVLLGLIKLMETGMAAVDVLSCTS